MDEAFSRRDLALLGAGVAAAASLPSTALAQARGTGPSGLTRGDWFAQVRAQHQAISAGFQMVRNARGPAAMKAAFKRLSTLLAAHSIAEEVALYPGPAVTGQGDQAEMRQLYEEQQMAKVMTARIDAALAMGQRDQAMTLLGQLEQALMAHVREEETQFFPALQRSAGAAMNDKMTRDFRMVFSQAMS